MSAYRKDRLECALSVMRRTDSVDEDLNEAQLLRMVNVEQRT
jgi:hypothetical protein